MEFDLNQEPLDQPHSPAIGLGSIVSEIESAQGHIEERIRRLEAVTSRARQRQRWRQGHTPLQITNVTASLEERDVQEENSMNGGQIDIAVHESTVESRKTSNRDNAHLVAKALEMDMDPKKGGSDSGGFFDCNICLEMAKDPILTCCGHLFCWPCFYQLSYSYSNAKECPVCRGEVTDTSIVPIYGNGSVNNGHQLESTETGFKIPPRPHASRVESMRQQLLSRATSSPMVDRIQRMVGHAMGDRAQLESLERTSERSLSSANQHRTSQSQALSSMETEINQNNSSINVSRLLMQGAASFSSLSSALNSAMDSAERLVEDLETYVNIHRIGTTHLQSSPVDGRDPILSIAGATESEIPSPEAALEINSAIPSSVSSVSRNAGVEIISMRNPSSSSRRRTDVPRVSDSDNGVSRETRRRRLR
ncbi:E3 ubiquitin-protein like [Quillaja saponaria]|uniref:E3 ubiquitin-protein ligase RMA n=1 Tax=Quillaja saponaria TaxID=32244 RepID=A0AAD7PBG6_QUISA|nr:E3 ubiquitin-protein like [Quillaja saponaria]